MAILPFAQHNLLYELHDESAFTKLFQAQNRFCIGVSEKFVGQDDSMCLIYGIGLLALLGLLSGWEDATITDIVAILGVELITAGAFFFLGGMIGSFLNVVIYRLPLRQNLLWPPSHCTSCSKRIALIDNIPVVSWLCLRGRCRKCKSRISPRYLLVEVSVGLLFLVLLYFEVHTGGSNLPLRTPNYYGTALWTIWYPRPDLLSLYAYHCSLIFFVYSLALFAIQEERLPGLYLGIAVLIGLLIPLWIPGVQLVPVYWDSHKDSFFRAEGIQPALVGMLVGGILGLALGVFCPPRKVRLTEPSPRRPIPTFMDLACLLSLVGIWLGWQAAVSVCVITVLGLLLSRGRLSVLIIGAIATLIQLLAWRVLTIYLPWWPGPHTQPLGFLLWIIALLGLMVLAKVLSSHKSSIASENNLP